ncbi:hypothetical protein DDZ18_03825 [Marinicauda salina]|uniref:Peptidase S74 domain-containing protein n=1 Tax=Marinicauda salina TaxID=2135793 RepID=A0A2U2BXI8_9PROT|nr:hypothetical protein [Marinicauda salina]PWE18731.1 hypothetical protein DDZ18_03825 [Marinicauda salina]
MKKFLLSAALGPVLGVLGLQAVEAQTVLSTTDATINDSLCVGTDCTSSETFGFDTIRIKENNTRLRFDDTSASGSFPANDWELIANESENGGVNAFFIEDDTAGRNILALEAGAPANSLYVESDGDVGFGTSNPVADLHMVTGDSPFLRLEQDGSSGFTPQTWDIAGNETNFFIRDATNGSTLPFRIRPGAPSNAIDIDDDGDVFVGLASNSTNIGDLVLGGGGVKLLDLVSDTAGQIRFIGDTTNRRIVARDADTGPADTQIIMRDSELAFAGADTSDANMFATFDTGGLDIGSHTDSTVRLMTIQSSTAAQMRLVGATNNRRFVASDTPLGAADTQIIMRDSEVAITGPDASSPWATITSSGIVTNGGGACDPGPCDDVFNPDVFQPLSIDEHAGLMWENSYLPGVGPTPEGAPINLGQKVTGVLHELEVAHIYIEQLNNRVNALEAELAEQEG